MKSLLRHAGVLLALVSPLTTLAQAGPQDVHPGPGLATGHHPGHGASPELRGKMQAYLEANVLPTLRQQRQQLEAQLAPADQAALASYRTQLRELRTQRQQLHQQLRPTPDASRPTPTDEQRQQLRTLHAQEWQLHDQVRELAHKYAGNIEQLTKLQPQREQWGAALLAMLPPRPADAPTASSQPSHPARWYHGGPVGELLRPTAFLLLEPAAPAAEPALNGTSLYPNPATASSQLQYEVKQAGGVRVELLNAQGQPLRPLLPEAVRQPGTYTQPLDFSALSPGTYYYKVTTAAGSEVKRFVKE